MVLFCAIFDSINLDFDENAWKWSSINFPEIYGVWTIVDPLNCSRALSFSAF